MDSKRLAGKTALVTGASQGMGASHAETLARYGAKVIAADVLDDKGNELVDGLAGEGLDIVYRHLDVASADEWARVANDIDPSWGPVTVLVNNAGVTSPESVLECSLEEWNRLVSINQTGIFLGLQAIVPGMIEAGGGSVVNIASSWAHRGGTENGFIAYVTTKAAVLGLTRNASMNFARHGVRVNSISPGYVKTAQVEMAERNEPERVAAALETIPMRRMATKNEISQTVSFLASDESTYTSGVDFLVDGGLNLTSG